MLSPTRFLAMAALIAIVSSVPVAVASAGGGPPSGSADRDETRRWDVTGPYGGSVRSLVIAPDDPSRVYIGTSDGQLYRSRDGGRSWGRAIPGVSRPGLVVDNVVFDPQNPQILYAGVWSVDDGKAGGVYKSTNGGDTWTELEDMRDKSVRALVVDPSDTNVLVVGAISGVFRSTDAGASWDRISPKDHPDLINVESVAIDPRNPQIIYAGTTHLPWKTLDGGDNWFPIKTGMLDDSDVFSIAILKNSPDRVFASACSGIYRSENAGMLWAKAQGIPFSSRRTRVIYPHPTRPEIVFAGTTQGLWRSMDSGQTWQLMTTKTLVVNAIDINPAQPDIVLLGTDEHGVLISRDLGQNFVESNAGFIHRHILSVLPDMTLPNRVYATVYHDGTAGGFFVSSDGGKSWRQSNRGLGGRDIFALFQDPDSPDTIYAGTNYGVYRTVNRGELWTFVGKPAKPAKPVKGKAGATRASASGSATGYSVVPAAAVSYKKTEKKAPSKSKTATKAKKPVGPPLVTLEEQVNAFTRYTDATGGRWLIAATNRGLFRTQSPDKGWESLKTPGLRPPFSTVSTSSVDPERILYLGTISGIALSRDGGLTWEQIHRGPDDSPIKSITQDPRDPQTVYVGSRGYFYKSTDGGRTWRKRGGGLPAGDITVVAVDPLNTDVIYAADYSAGGIFRSRNKGEDWERLDAGLPSARVWTLATDPFDPGRVYAGSFSGGVYVLTTSQSVAGASN